MKKYKKCSGRNSVQEKNQMKIEKNRGKKELYGEKRVKIG